MSKYRFLVLYTLGESERNEFLTKIQEKYPEAVTLHDQSSLAIDDSSYDVVLQYLEYICKEFNREEKGHFVNLYYPYVLLYRYDKDKAFIGEKVVWKSNN